MSLPEPEPSGVAARWAWAALFAYPPTVALCYIIRLSLVDAFVLAALVTLLPLLAVAQVPLAKASLGETTPLDRNSVYKGVRHNHSPSGRCRVGNGPRRTRTSRARAGDASSSGAPGLELWFAGGGAHGDRAFP